MKMDKCWKINNKKQEGIMMGLMNECVVAVGTNRVYMLDSCKK